MQEAILEVFIFSSFFIITAFALFPIVALLFIISNVIINFGQKSLVKYHPSKNNIKFIKFINLVEEMKEYSLPLFSFLVFIIIIYTLIIFLNWLAR